MSITYADQRPPEKIEKHYTPLALAARLVSLVPVEKGDIVLDPCSGKNKAFYDAFPFKRYARELELDEGDDFLATPHAYDWSITNPPYHLLWKFIDKTSLEARKGFAFLVNINGINTLTPKRLELLRERGFHMRRLHVLNVKQWMGRYYFYVFSKQKGGIQHSWDKQTWQ